MNKHTMLGPIDDGWGLSGWVEGLIGAVCFIPAIIIALLVNAYPTAYTIGYGLGILLATYVIFRLINGAAQELLTQAAN